MRKSRFSEEQIIGILKEHQTGLPVGAARNSPITRSSSDQSSSSAIRSSPDTALPAAHQSLRQAQLTDFNAASAPP